MCDLDDQLQVLLSELRAGPITPVTQLPSCSEITAQCPRCGAFELIYDPVADANYCQRCEYPAYERLTLAEYKSHLQEQYERWIMREFAEMRAAAYGKTEEKQGVA